ITIAGAIFPLLVTIAGLRILYLLRPHIPDARLRWLALIYTALQMTPLLAVGFPWHSSWTETASLYALLATFALATSTPPLRSTHLELPTHLALAETLLLLARHIRTALLAIISAALLASLLLAFAHTSVLATYSLYFQLTSRFQPGHFLAGILYNKDLSVGFQRWTIYAILVPATLWIIIQSL